MPYVYLFLLILVLCLLLVLAALVGSVFRLMEIYMVNLLLAAVPAGIALQKGRNWKLWYLYGIFLWPVAVCHIVLLDRDIYGWIGEKRYRKASCEDGQGGFGAQACFRREKGLDELMAELNGLTGLGSVKEHLGQLFSRLRADEERRRRGLPVMGGTSLHMVFTGNPGTGKTTVARLIAGIYKEMGLVRTGAFVEADRSSLVAEYIGQTAVQTNAKISEALGGVLFIDEAYSLYKEDSPRDFGHEAIETLLKAMEDKRDDLVVIVAGYTDLMHDFLTSNPGLISRFNKYIDFPDYTDDELMDILAMNAKRQGYTVSEEAGKTIRRMLSDMSISERMDYGNARGMRNTLEKLVQAQANRLADEKKVTKEMLIELTQADAMAALYPDEEQGKESDQALESALELQEEKEEKKEKKEKKESAGNGTKKKDAEAEDAGSQL